MGILSALKLTRAAADTRLAVANAALIPSGTAVVDLPTDVAEAFGVHTSSDRVTRAQAVGVPAIKRGRNIIAGTIGTLDLLAVNRAGQLVDSGSVARLLGQLDPRTTPQFTLTWTVDDLLFYGVAWWRVTDRDASTGYPVAVQRVDPTRVYVDVTAGVVHIDGRPVPDRDLIRFDGPDQGLCVGSNGSAIATAILLERAVRRNADGMPPADLLRLAEGAQPLSSAPGSANDPNDPEASQVDALLDAWLDARRHRSTAFLNAAVEWEAAGIDPQRLQLAEARQHQAAELARLMNLDPDRIGAPAGSSMTYANTESKRRDLVDVTLRPFITAIGQRLSMGDVSPTGTKVAFDVVPFLRGTTADAIEAGAQAVDAGLLTPEEVRTDLLGRPATPRVGQLQRRDAGADPERTSA